MRGVFTEAPITSCHSQRRSPGAVAGWGHLDWVLEDEQGFAKTEKRRQGRRNPRRREQYAQDYGNRA